MIWALVVLGVVGVGIGVIWGDHYSDSNLKLFAAYIGDVGGAMIGGGVAGAVIKLLAVEGVFLDAVAAVAYSADGLTRRSEADRTQLWRDLTRMIYLPFLGQPTSQSQPRIASQELAAEIEQAITKTFTYNRKFYIQKLHRRLELRWADEAKRRIEVVDIQTIEIIPFRSDEKITWSSRSTPDAGRKMDDYEIKDVECSIKPEPPQKPDITTSDQARVTNWVLQDSDKYEMYRHRNLRWTLNADPVLAFESPYVVRNLTIDIFNRAEGLRITFRDIGGADLFQKKGGVGKQIEYEEHAALGATNLLLPDQGFLLLLLDLKPNKSEQAISDGNGELSLNS